MASTRKVTADYDSQTEQKTFAATLSTATSATSSTSEKTAYLGELREHVSQMQDDINAFLTAKMEEDKAAEQAAGHRKVKGIDEDKEEQMYGEEDPEDDS